jgi:elongation factor G
MVVSAVGGIKFETENVWKYADEEALPRMVIINKMDRERADFQKVLENMGKIFGIRPLPLQWPIGKEASFRGVVDLLQMKARIFRDDGSGQEDVEEVPPEVNPEAQKAREALVESVAESNDALLEKYLDGQTLDDGEIRASLRAGVISGKIVPVVFTVAVNNWGTAAVANSILDLLPSPRDRGPVTAKTPADEREERLEPKAEAPFAALVFKTIVDPYTGKISLFRVYSGKLQGEQVYNCTRGVRERIGQLSQVLGKTLKAIPEVGPGDFAAVVKLKETFTGDTLCDEKQQLLLPPIAFPTPVMSMAIEPKTKGDEDKLSTVLTRLTEADASLQISRDPQTRELLISAMGQQHVEILVERLSRLGVEVSLKEPKVPYRETISRTATTQYRHKKQTGGAGQFAEVHLKVEPLSRGSGFEYGWKVFGGAISTSFQPSIEKGIRQVLGQGVIAGYPVVDVKAVVLDGKEHPVDSKDIAFQIAGREVFKLAVQGAGPKLLEPIMTMTIAVPDEFVGDVIGDLNSRRGRVSGVEGSGGRQIIAAKVPLAETLRYATELTSMTGGRGQFTLHLSHYEEVPEHLTEKIVAASKKREEERKS